MKTFSVLKKHNLIFFIVLFIMTLICTGCESVFSFEKTKYIGTKTICTLLNASGLNDENYIGKMIADCYDRFEKYMGSEEVTKEIAIREKINSMTLEEKVAQLFIVYPESLVPGVNCVTAALETTKKAIDTFPVGGVIYMNENIRNPEQLSSMLSNIQEYSINRIGLPLFLCVDEEGGTIARIANNASFKVSKTGSMADIGATGDSNLAYIAGTDIGQYLSELGFNLDFAPVADLSGNGYNSVLVGRAFSDNKDIVSEMACSFSDGLKSKGIISVYKHFPGHGSTVGDPHKGYAYSNKTIEELKKTDVVPFKHAIDNNASMIMVGHISLPNVVGDETPSSLSPDIVNGLLREDLGYEGVVVTDAMNMGAIKDNYDADVAAIMAISSGVDIILMSKDFEKAYNGVIKAVENRQIKEERIDESLYRIIRLKYKYFGDVIK